MKWFTLVWAILIFIGRFTVPGHDLSYAGSYEAFAHILVGWLLAICTMIYYEDRYEAYGFWESLVSGYLLNPAAVILWSLSLFELGMFLTR